MQKYKLLLLAITVAVPLVLSGCTISFNTGDSTAVNGGVYASSNRGDTWIQKVLIPTTSGKPKSIAGLDANSLAMDPSDYKTLYFGSQDNGLFFTYDRGDSWQIATNLNKINVKAVAVDPDDTCTVYAASDNKVYKSTDCSRSWSQIYYDNDPAVVVTTISIDSYNSSNVFIGLTRGDVLKSTDKGGSWRTVARFDNRVEKIAMGSADTRIIFAGTKGKGLFRSTDNGNNWTDLGDKLKEFKNSTNFRDLAVSRARPGYVILANDYGLIASDNNGDSWNEIKLITPEKEAIINSVFIGPKNEQEIYYVTNTTFYRSLDGGQNWATKKLPTSRAGWRLIVDPENTNLIYLAARAIKK